MEDSEKNETETEVSEDNSEPHAREILELKSSNKELGQEIETLRAALQKTQIE